ncbi:MAG: mannose-1-phosphate guanylyltransferase [Deltaproteobacteria bacterium]|nr:mannose-1-phosphate guanylyltransferase [Deltaproteobacteria bacterium]
MAIHAVIMAGGSGTRFWPESREKHPKQLLALLGEKSLLRETYERNEGLVGPERTWCVVADHLVDATAGALPEVPRDHILAEPVGRNTAPCVAFAATWIARADPEAILVVLPADHHIADGAKFRRAVSAAAEVAARGDLVAVGIEPRRAETGYGYIRLAVDPPEEVHSEHVSRVVSFTEKPDAATAEVFVRSGNYLWNAGIFVFSARAILSAIEQFLPFVARGFADAVKAAGTANERPALAALYDKVAPISIDNGVMEHAKNLRVVRGDFGWNDVGSWEALSEVLPHDGSLNVVGGKFVGVDSRNLIVHSKKQLVAALGCDDLIIVATDDVILVAPREKAQDVRRMVDEVRRRNLKEYL